MRKQSKSFRLNVYYDIDRYPGFGLDSTIRGIVGRPEEGAGTNLVTRIRDISFLFKDESSAKKALARLKKKKIEAELISD
jgi:parvulin-like peptidyl-prolyl isomerase